MSYSMELVYVWGRFSIIRVQDKQHDPRSRFYPMERTRLGYDHVWFKGDWVFLSNEWDAILYLHIYAHTSPIERLTLKPQRTKRKGTYHVDSHKGHRGSSYYSDRTLGSSLGVVYGVLT